MDAISTTNLGTTDLKIPILGLGTAPLGGVEFDPISETNALETVAFALEHDIFLFDTAPYYGLGKSERFLGRALSGVPRDRYRLSTKVGRVVDEEAQTFVFDYSHDGVMRSIESSLARLQTDRVDILHIHDPDDHYREALDEAFPTLADLRSQGVIQAVSAGMNQWEMLADFARNADFDCFLLAGRYTLLEQESLDFVELCQQKQIGVLLGGVYNSGILATGAGPTARYNYTIAPEEIMERVTAIEKVCQRHGVPLKVAAIQFPLAHPGVTAMVVGAQSPEEVSENIRNLEHPIPPDLWNDLKSQGLLHEAAPVPA